MDMLCIAAEADPIGTMTWNGEPLSVADIARMTGGEVTEVATLLNELDRNGVLSRDRNGTIYNRRMVREAKKARTAQKNGKLGGNPSLRKDREIPPSDNPSDNPEVKAGDKPHIPEARDKKELFRAIDEWFDKFWKAYPSRGKAANPRKPAYEKFRRLVIAGSDPAAIVSAASQFAADRSGEDPRFTPQASRWLNEERWRDFGSASNGVDASDDDWRKRLAYARQNRRWSRAKWCPAPGEPGCRVPEHLIEPGDGTGWAEWGEGH